MPKPPDNDLLLKSAWIILTGLLGLMIVLGAIVSLCIPIILTGPPTLMKRLAESNIGPDQLPWIATLLAMLVVGIALGFMFLRQLRRIVATVSAGDPFVSVNAARLRTMAWLVLAMQALAWIATPLVVWIDSFPTKGNVHHNDNGLSLGALIMALLLFVLARVFRVGTAMRDELEGTV